MGLIRILEIGYLEVIQIEFHYSSFQIYGLYLGSQYSVLFSDQSIKFSAVKQNQLLVCKDVNIDNGVHD